MEATEKLALSVQETASLLGISKPTVYELIHRVDFPSFQIGRRTLISRVGLAEWVETQASKNERG